MTEETASRHSDVVLLGAGLADLAVGALSSAVGGLRTLLGRSDVADLAGESRQELKARGQLALDRCTVTAPAHLEVLARRAVARRGDGADA